MKCPSCTSKSIEKQAKYRAEHICFSNLERVKCMDCGLYFAHPMPKTNSLEKYNASYHESAHGGRERNKKQRAFFSGLAKTRLTFIQSNIDLKSFKKLNVLEIGPGPGAFVEVWKEKFPQTIYYVLESDKSCYQSLLDIGVEILDEKKFASLSINFDIIILSHVLEHVTNPVEFLNSFVYKLNVGGHMFIEVPCLDWKHKNLDEPHLLFFDKPSVNRLLERIQLKKIRLAYYGILIDDLLNPLNKFFRRLRGYLWRKGIVYYHPERKNLLKIFGNEMEAEATLNYYPHKEQTSHAWWLRLIAKKE